MGLCRRLVGRCYSLSPALLAVALVTQGCTGDFFRQVFVQNDRADRIVVIDEGVFDRSSPSFTVRVNFIVPGNSTNLVVEDHATDGRLRVLTSTCSEIGTIDLAGDSVSTVVVVADLTVELTAPPSPSAYASQTQLCEDV